MFGLGMPELIVILIIGLVVFGPKKFPEIAKSIGKGMREFKKSLQEGLADDSDPKQENKKELEEKD